MKHVRLTRLVAILLLATLLILTFASCTVKKQQSTTTTTATATATTTAPPAPVLRDPYTGLSSSKYKIGDPSLVNQYTEADEAAIRSTVDRLNALLAQGTEQQTFMDLYTDFEEQYEYLLYNLSLANIEFYLLQDSEEAEDNYLYLTSLSTEIEQSGIRMYRTVYDSPFRDAFYEGWTRAEIEEVLRSAEQYTDEYVAMQELDEQYLVEYRDLLANSDFDAIAELYIEFVKNKNAMARALGYGDYMEFAYDAVYARDYEVEEASAAERLIKQLIPYIRTAYNAYYETAMGATQEEALQFASLVQTKKFTTESNKAFLRDFYLDMSADAAELFDGVWTGGHYFIASDANKSYEGAFTTSIHKINRPVMYFGPGYHGMTTFVHEFGHYMAQFLSTAEDLNYDLAEVHSQGAEMLYLRYLQNGSFFSQNTTDLLAQYTILNMLITIALATSVNAFETYVYANIDTIKADDLQDLFEDAVDGIAGLDLLTEMVGEAASTYWAYVCVESPGYYISYAMSALPALSLYAMSDSDYEGTAAVYLQLLEVDTDGFCSELAEVGMYSPFDRELYAIIEECFTKELR